jgi:hypothetical protein
MVTKAEWLKFVESLSLHEIRILTLWIKSDPRLRRKLCVQARRRKKKR